MYFVGPGGGGGRKLRPTGESSEGSGDNNSLPLAIVTAVFAALILGMSTFAVAAILACIGFPVAMNPVLSTSFEPSITISLARPFQPRRSCYA